MADTGELNEPVMAGSTDATDREKIAGILAQTRQDGAGRELSAVLRDLRERLDQADIELDDIQIARYAHEITGA